MRRFAPLVGIVVAFTSAAAPAAPPSGYSIAASPTHGVTAARFALTYRASGACAGTGSEVEFYWDHPYPQGYLLAQAPASTVKGGCTATVRSLRPPKGHDASGSHGIYGYTLSPLGSPDSSTQAMSSYRIDPAVRPSPTPSVSSTPARCRTTPTASCDSPSPSPRPSVTHKRKGPCTFDPDLPTLCHRRISAAAAPTPIEARHEDNTASRLLLLLVAMFVLGTGALAGGLWLSRSRRA